MKKLLALSLAMLFLGVGIASATDFTLTGSYFARGSWSDNWTGTALDSTAKKNQYGVYDHELSLDANWQVSPYTKVFARFEIRDEAWGVSSNPTEASMNGGQTDDNIVVEYVYGQHTFGNGTTIRTGLMGTSSWATEFGNEGTEAYRVMLIKNTKIGQLIAFTEKPQNSAVANFLSRPSEDSYSGANDANDDDTDSYVVALVTKVGGTTLMPLLKYADAESSNYAVMALDFGAMGSFNNIGWEAEFVYVDYDYDNDTGIALGNADYDVWGLFVDVWAQLNAFKVGGFVAYGSYDEDVNKGYEFGDDFACNGAMILGDELFMYNNYTPSGLSAAYGANDMQAATVYGVYGSYAVNEKLTLSAYAAIATSEVDNPGTAFDGAEAWEVNVQGSYKITDNVTYSAGAAQAQLEYGNAQADPDEAIEIFHKLAFSF